MTTETKFRFVCVEIPQRQRGPRITTTTTTTTKPTITGAAAVNTLANAETSFTHTHPRTRRRSDTTSHASAALTNNLPKKLKKKLYRHETVKILEAVAIPPYKMQKSGTQKTRRIHQKLQAPTSRPRQGSRSKGSTNSTYHYGTTSSITPSTSSSNVTRRTIIMDSGDESDQEHYNNEDYEEGGEMSMSSLVRKTKLAWNTTKVAHETPRVFKPLSKGKPKPSSSSPNHRKKNEKLRKRLLQEVELDEDAGIALLPVKRARNLSNSSFRQRLQLLRSKGFASRETEGESSSDVSDDSDDSSDDSDIPDSQGNIAGFVIQDNGEDTEKALAQIPEKFRRDHDQTPKNDFKLYIEYLFWLVYDKRALDNQGSKYDAPVQRIMKILSTYQSTLSSSGTWSPNFLALVDQRPKLRKVTIVDEDETFCAACKNKSHKAQFAVTLFGSEYNVPMKPSELGRFSIMFSPSTGTQRIDTNSDSDGQGIRFKLGTTCTTRSILYHQVRHFSYHCLWKVIEHCVRRKDQPRMIPIQTLVQNRKKGVDKDRVDAAFLVTTLQSVTSKLWSEFDNLKTGFTKLP